VHLAHSLVFGPSSRPFLPGIAFQPDFPLLFNSYYEGFSASLKEAARLFSVPLIEEILRYRDAIATRTPASVQRNVKLFPASIASIMDSSIRSAPH